MVKITEPIEYYKELVEEPKTNTCQGFTQKGLSCKHKVPDGEIFCDQHKPRFCPMCGESISHSGNCYACGYNLTSNKFTDRMDSILIDRRTTNLGTKYENDANWTCIKFIFWTCVWLFAIITAVKKLGESL